MSWIESFLTYASDFIWGTPLLVLLVGTGIFLTFRLAFIQVRLLPFSLKQVFSRSHDQGAEGDISQFQALTTAMAATVGVGNIVGVAAAVAAGGPGAIFWMWMAGFFGMATKYSEALLAVKYRETKPNGQKAGGPMYYLEHGLKQKWLAVLFALFGALAAFGIGNGTQAKAIADAVNSTFHLPHWLTGIALVIIGGLVILGGIQSIGKVTSFFVPIMAIFYFFAGLVVVILNYELVPAAFGLIFTDAFTGQAVAGGAIGTVIRFGVARGLFSNEAGLGSAPIAAAAAKTDAPGRQALISMTQVLFDTLIICTITGLTVVMSGLWSDPLIEDGALTAAAFGQLLGPIGPYIVSIGLIFFATSTILGWSYYGEKCLEYLIPNESAVKLYRIVFVLFIFVGATASLDVIWKLADVLNGLMAIPNLIGLLGLSGVVVYETKKFHGQIKKERAQSNHH